ncbi:MAG: ribosome silencing factor [Betaproteobacteria bacterium]|nr:ribosome silencing factor [Betaproteobacteria bacterium]
MSKQKSDSHLIKAGERILEREELVKLAMAIGLEKKAMRPMAIDLRSQGAFTEYFVILSATNARQVAAVAEEIRLFFRDNLSLQPVSIDGREARTWILLDYGFLFVHVFQEPTRELYALEQLWGKGRYITPTEQELSALLTEVKAALPKDISSESLEAALL